MSTLKNFVTINVGRMKGFIRVPLDSHSMIKWDSGVGKGTLTNQALVLALSPNIKYAENKSGHYDHYNYMLKTSTENKGGDVKKEVNEELARVFQLRENGVISVDKSCLIIEYENDRTDNTCLAITYLDPKAINRTTNPQNIVLRTFISISKKDVPDFYNRLTVYLEDGHGSKMKIPDALDKIKHKLQYHTRELQPPGKNNTESSSPYTDEASTNKFYLSSRKEINDFIELAIQSDKKKIPTFILSEKVNNLNVSGSISRENISGWVETLKSSEQQVLSSPVNLQEQVKILKEARPLEKLEESMNIEERLVVGVNRALKITDDNLDEFDGEIERTKREIRSDELSKKEITTQKESLLERRSSKNTILKAFQGALSVANSQESSFSIADVDINKVHQLKTDIESSKSTANQNLKTIKDKISGQRSSEVKAKEDDKNAKERLIAHEQSIKISRGSINNAHSGMAYAKKISINNPQEIKKIKATIISFEKKQSEQESIVKRHHKISAQSEAIIEQNRIDLSDKERAHQKAKTNISDCERHIKSNIKEKREQVSLLSELEAALENVETYGNTNNPNLLRIRFFTNKTTFLVGAVVSTILSATMNTLFSLFKAANQESYDSFFADFDESRYGETRDVKSEMDKAKKTINQLDSTAKILKKQLVEYKDLEVPFKDPQFRENLVALIGEQDSKLKDIKKEISTQTTILESYKSRSKEAEDKLIELSSKSPEQLDQEYQSSVEEYEKNCIDYEAFEENTVTIENSVKDAQESLVIALSRDTEQDLIIKAELETEIKSLSTRQDSITDLISRQRQVCKEMDITTEQQNHTSTSDIDHLCSNKIKDLDAELNLITQEEEVLAQGIKGKSEILIELGGKLMKIQRLQDDFNTLKKKETFKKCDLTPMSGDINLDDDKDAFLLLKKSKRLIETIKGLKKTLTSTDNKLRNGNYDTLSFDDLPNETLHSKYTVLNEQIKTFETCLQNQQDKKANVVEHIQILFEDILKCHESIFSGFARSIKNAQSDIKNNSGSAIGNHLVLDIDHQSRVSKGIFKIPVAGMDGKYDSDGFFDLFAEFFTKVASNNKYMFDSLNNADIATFVENISSNWDNIDSSIFEPMIDACVNFNDSTYKKKVLSIILDNSKIKAVNANGETNGSSTGQALTLVTKLSIYLLSKSKKEIHNFPFIVDEPSGALSLDVLAIKKELGHSNLAAIFTQNQAKYSDKFTKDMFVFDSKELISKKLWTNVTTYNKQLITMGGE